MIRLPSKGLARSVRKHNSNLGVVSDWVALSVVAAESEAISKSDVLDVLMEEQIYDVQDFCNEYLADVWRELRRRNSQVGDGVIEVDANRARSVDTWPARAELVFPIVLSLGSRFDGWSDEFGDYVEQGRLFERLVLALIGRLFQDWEVVDCGWAASEHPLTLAETVAGLGTKLRCVTRDDEISKWAGASAKDAGLDFALFRVFADARGAYPVFLGQVASGEAWIGKLKQPDMAVWAKLLSFVSIPRRALVIPDVLDGDEFDRRANQVEGLLIDRLRLFDGFVGDALVPELRQEIVDWITPRLEWMAA